MYHSIIFGPSVQSIVNVMHDPEVLSDPTVKHTWDDWHLIPSSRPTLPPPPVKTKDVDIPGADGKLDLTEILAGVPLYGNRTGSIDFLVAQDWYNKDTGQWETWNWITAYQTIMAYLHGQRMYMIMEDDPGYYYSGRFSVNSWKSDKNFSQISINYDLDPFKWSIYSSADDWLWDPFDFETGYINELKNVSIAGATEVIVVGGTRRGMFSAKATPVNSDSSNQIKLLSVNDPNDLDSVEISGDTVVSITGQPYGASGLWIHSSTNMTLKAVDGTALETAETISSTQQGVYYGVTSVTIPANETHTVTINGTGTISILPVFVSPISISTTSMSRVLGVFIQNGSNKLVFTGQGTIDIDYRGSEF